MPGVLTVGRVNVAAAKGGKDEGGKRPGTEGLMMKGPSVLPQSDACAPLSHEAGARMFAYHGKSIHHP